MDIEGDNLVRLTNSAESNKKNLTSNNWRDERPRISPDGSTILFMSNRDGNYEIYTMDVDGKNQTRLTKTPEQEIFPTWSNDGSQIAYSLHRFINGRPEADIHVMSADGTNDKVLTSAAGRDENAAWGPDDDYIFFQSERNGNFEVYRMKSDGSEQMRLTADPAWDGWVSAGPAGSLFGQQIYHETYLNTEVHKINLEGMPKGICFLIVTGTDPRVCSRFIIE